jgi:hypothetical protein
MFVICTVLVAVMFNGDKVLTKTDAEGKLLGKEDQKSLSYLVDFSEGVRLKYSNAIGDYSKVSVLKTECIKE